MKFAFVVIWYNPDESNKNNVLEYAGFAAKTYIIDNSTSNNEKLTSGIPNCIYVANLGNEGISAAQNKGCELAFKDGFEWCMTMDQDSNWSQDMLSAYLKRCDAYIQKNRYWSFAPDTTDAKTTFLLKEVKKGILHLLHKDKLIPVQQVDAVIASGNLINLQKWKEIGGFNEELFIDSVDHEFCLRLIEKYPESILLFNDIKLTHSLGDAHFSLLTRFDFHSGVRLYYMTRNVLYLRDRFPQFVKTHGLFKKIIFIFLQNMRDFRYRDCSFMRQGYRAWKHGEKGPYKPN